jgi:hypothetical protein
MTHLSIEQDGGNFLGIFLLVGYAEKIFRGSIEKNGGTKRFQNQTIGTGICTIIGRRRTVQKASATNPRRKEAIRKENNEFGEKIKGYHQRNGRLESGESIYK